MRRLHSAIEEMHLGKRLVFSPPDNQQEKQAPATIQLMFSNRLSAEEVQKAADMTGLSHSLYGKFVVVKGAGFRVHVARPTLRGTFLQIQRTGIDEALPSRGKVLEFLLNLPPNRKRSLLSKAAQLFAKLRR